MNQINSKYCSIGLFTIGMVCMEIINSKKNSGKLQCKENPKIQLNRGKTAIKATSKTTRTEKDNGNALLLKSRATVR